MQRVEICSKQCIGVGNFTCEGKNYAYITLLYGSKLFSLCAGNSIVPNRCAVLEDRPYVRG